MAPEKFTAEQFWAELDEIGEDEVRVRVTTGRYSTLNKKRQLAEEWLRKKDQTRVEEAERRTEASQSEQIEIAREAKNAAVRAATAAEAAALAAESAAATAEADASTARDTLKVAERQEKLTRAANTRHTIMLIIAVISVAVAIIVPLLSKN